MKRILCTLTVLMSLVLCTSAYADIFGQRPEKKLSAVQNQQIAYPVDPGTILSDVTQVTGYLGVREGSFYDFNAGEFCNYAAATVYTVQPYGIAFDIGALNTDGFAGTVDVNIGSVIPAQDVPLLNMVQYLYVGGGIGERYLEKSNDDPSKTWKFAYGVDAQFKFTF